jgi:hypothetical protein
VKLEKQEFSHVGHLVALLVEGSESNEWRKKMTEHDITKALEIWTLQNLCDLAILAGFVALGLIAARAYLERMKSRLTLRVAVEAWESLTDLAVDALLAGIALVALLVTNMDIMADIKIGLPFVPLGFLLMTMALVLRLFHGGGAVGSKTWTVVLVLLVLGCLVNWFGFTFVMEGAGDEYVELHPSSSAFWKGLDHMRSNKNPDLAMATFVWAGPSFLLVFGWAVVVGAIRSVQWAKRRAASPEAGKGETHGS